MRMEKQNSQYTIAYGLDHHCGLFFQIFDDTRRGEKRDEPIVSEDKLTNPTITVKRIVSIAEDYGFDLSMELSELTIT
jgi:hypothetical protein